jgi:tetratricopeptide (TPR) repeat protein
MKQRKREISLLVLPVFLVFCLSVQPLFSQSIKKYLKEANLKYNEGDFLNAQINFKEVLAIDSSFVDVQLKYADCCRNLLLFDEAEHWYDKVYKKDKGQKYPDAYFWLATVKQEQGKYKDARKLFDKYAKKFKKKKTYMAQKAAQGVLSCDFAQLALATKGEIKILHLDSNVNSVNAEFGAFDLNDSLLYFTSLRGDKQKKMDKNGRPLEYAKIYLSKLESDKQKLAELQDTLFNTQGLHNGNTCFSADGNKFYFTRCINVNLTDMRCEIFVREYSNGHWQRAIKLGSDINVSGYTSTQPNSAMLDSLGEVLFFSSNKPGGEGKMDIWAANVGKEGYNAKSYNLGKSINSLDNEITPYYNSRYKILYFSSDWYPGFGGFDIFRSYHKNGSWSAPENMGSPINSPQNDLYYTITAKGKKAFLTSNRIGSFYLTHATCCNDIWSYIVPGSDTLDRPKLIDSTVVRINEIKLLVPLTLYFHNDEPDARTKAITTTKNYRKTFDDYYVMKEKYEKEFTHGMKEDEKDKATTSIDDFFEDSVASGMHDLDRFAELLVKILKDGEQVQITMKGYCSPLASTDYNINLAKRRISSLRNYFMEYQDGVLKQYVNNTDTIAGKKGKLEFFDEDIGELKARPNVSDDYYDTRNSIYNPNAAAERKIQIIAFSSKSFK